MLDATNATQADETASASDPAANADTVTLQQLHADVTLARYGITCRRAFHDMREVVKGRKYTPAQLRHLVTLSYALASGCLWPWDADQSPTSTAKEYGCTKAEAMAAGWLLCRACLSLLIEMPARTAQERYDRLLWLVRYPGAIPARYRRKVVAAASRDVALLASGRKLRKAV
ncbi:MAG TPA: hypothetical protein VFB13_03720 [Reyranella sp.]|nr:hypothetical protein [Reyranella sp.]